MSNIKHEVVYNACFGGFSLSEDAMLMLVELGVQAAQKELDFWIEGSKGKSRKLYSFYMSPSDVPRHDKRLIQVVKKLGHKAGGAHARLEIAEISGNKYRINEYDGSESVIEPNDDEWTVIE